MFEQAEVEARHTNNDSLLDSQFYFNYGVSAEQSGLYDRASVLLKKSLQMEDNPRQIANASNYLGFMWVDHDQNIEEGGDLIKKAMEIEPDNGAYLDSLGWYYYKTNHFDHALGQLQQAVEKLKPEDPVVYEHLGDIYLKLNDTAKAVGCLGKSDGTRPEEPGRGSHHQENRGREGRATCRDFPGTATEKLTRMGGRRFKQGRDGSPSRPKIGLDDLRAHSALCQKHLGRLGEPSPPA